MKQLIKYFVVIIGCLFVLFSTHLSSAHAAPPTVSEYPTLAGSAGPFGIAAGPDGNMWFAERNANNIAKITPSGSVTEYPVPANSEVFEVTAGKDGNMWFTEPLANKIGKVTTSGAVTEYTLPINGSAPRFITAGPDGNIWFTMESANDIGRITSTGTITDFPVSAFGHSEGITGGPGGNVWFTRGSNIDSIAPDGTITVFPDTSDGGTSSPAQITTGADGNLWFIDLQNSGIGKMTPTGTITDYTVSGIGAMGYGITAGPDGNVWFTELAPNAVASITPSGVVTQYNALTSSSGPSGIAAGPDGNVWFTEQSTSNIAKVNLSITPTVSNQTVNVSSGSSITVTVGNNLSGDLDPASLKIVSGPSHGTAHDPILSITYQSNNGYSGQDMLTYEFCSLNDVSLCTQSTLTFNVAASTPSAPNTGIGKVAQSQFKVAALSIFTSINFLAGGIWLLLKRKLNN